jgi:flagellar basal body rod protein FlgG
MTNSYRQDVIANNLANQDTVGFKRDLVNSQERRMATAENPSLKQYSDAFYNNMGGGTLLAPTVTDNAPGAVEVGNNLDAAIQGEGYFVVENAKGRFLTRAGQFGLDVDGNLMQLNSAGSRVLTKDMQPIKLDPNAVAREGSVYITATGDVMQDGESKGTLAVKLPDASSRKVGAGLYSAPDAKALPDAASPTVLGGCVERSNVDPTRELTEMMRTQRLLEANANMIKYQDTSLSRLMTETGKI